MIVILLKFPCVFGIKECKQIIVARDIGYEEFKFRELWFALQYLQNFGVYDVLSLDDDGLSCWCQKLLDHSSAIDVANDQIGVNVFHRQWFPFSIFEENIVQARPYSAMGTLEKILAIGGKWAVIEICSLDDKGVVDEIDFGVHVFSFHLFIRFHLDSWEPGESLLDDFEGILILLKFLIF